VRGLQADGETGAKTQQEGVGEASTTVHLQSKIETLPTHAPQEVLHPLRVRRVVLRLTHAGAGGHNFDAIQRSRSPAQKCLMQLFCEIDDFRVGPLAAQSLQRGQGEDKIADAIGAKYGDLSWLSRWRHGFVMYLSLGGAGGGCCF